MKKLFFYLLSLFFSIPFLHAQEKQNLELLDIFDLEYVSDPQISPDGKQIVYVRNFKDVMTDRNLSNLWIINFDGSENRPLTTGKNGDLYPRWSPDGTKILFKSNEAGEMSLYQMWLDTRQKAVLSDADDLPQHISWSPDGKTIAYTRFVPEQKEAGITLPKKPEGAEWNAPPKYITEQKYRSDGQGFLQPGFNQIFILPVDNRTPIQLTFSKFDKGAPVWGKNGRELYFSANMNDNHLEDPLNSEIYKFNINTGNITALTDRQGPDQNRQSHQMDKQ